MMIIDVRKLNAQKKYFGSMEFEYDAPKDLLEIPLVRFSAPVKVVFEYDLYEDDSLEVKGTVAYKLEGQCSRCLQAAAAEIVGELDAYFEPRKDYEDYGYTNGVIDLKKAVDDAIMASMPFSISCGESCEGISYVSETDLETKKN